MEHINDDTFKDVIERFYPLKAACYNDSGVSVLVFSFVFRKHYIPSCINNGVFGRRAKSTSTGRVYPPVVSAFGVSK
jgi:hypothetical protein